jgi:uncharacterized protein YhfF
MNWRALETFAFGDNPALADELLALVLEGKKRATCWAVSEGLKGAAVGKSIVALDGQGRPRAVLTTKELVQRRFYDVDDQFAHDEGEGDRSLAYWREAHKRYFTRLGLFGPDIMLWCERFTLEHVIERS